MQPPAKRAVALSCLLALGMGCYYFALFLPYSHSRLEAAGLGRGYRYGCDLYPIWLTGRQIRVDPYSAEKTKQIQIGLYGRALGLPGDPPVNYRAFAYPLYAELFAVPLAWLPFPVVQAIGSLLFPLVVVCTCWLWMRFLQISVPRSSLFSFLLLTLASYPVLEGIYALQPSLIVSLLLAGTALALARNRLVAAGTLLALASVKPQLIVMVAAGLLFWAVADFRRRRKFVFGFFGTLLLLFSVAQWASPGWIVPWVHSLIDYRQYTDPPLVQFALGPVAGNLLAIGLLASAGVFTFRVRRAHAASPQFAMNVSYLLAITVLLVPSSIAVYDHILLLPAVLWLIFRADTDSKKIPVRILALAAMAALAWQWITALGMDFYASVAPQVRESSAVMLPLRMAASVPFATVALWLFLVWKVKINIAEDAEDSEVA